MNAPGSVIGLTYRTRRHWRIVVALLLTFAGAVAAFPLSYVSNANVLIGACLLPFCVFIQGRPRVNYFYLLMMLLMASLAVIYHVRIFYFFALAFYALFVVELSLGRTGNLVLFLTLFMSPFFEQAGVILGFPIRLQLSAWAGDILSLIGLPVTVSGNNMAIEGAVFAVDQACMGLHLLSISLLMGAFILSHRCKKEGLQPSCIPLTIFFLIVFILNVVSNLVRICLLVTFRIAPENVMHDGVGILCLLVYVMVPLYFISHWIVRKYGNSIPDIEGRDNNFSLVGKIAWIFAIPLFITGVHVKDQRADIDEVYAEVQLAGDFVKQEIAGSVTKLSNQDLLIYVKPIPHFFTSEHTPLICWRGSGYTFEGIREETIMGREIYLGRLVNSGSQLFTAWWYDNGRVATISQADWRMRMFIGEASFCLVNITSGSEHTLLNELHQIFEKPSLSIHAK